jgi:predicted ATP-dependent Lon-type protease
VSDVTLAQSYGMAADYLSEALHALRDLYECDGYINRRIKVTVREDIRDEKAILRSAEGFLSLLFPHLKRIRIWKTAQFNRFRFERGLK